MITFDKRTLKSTIKNAALNFAVDKQKIEFRKDPLTKKSCRINISRANRPHPGLGGIEKDLKTTIEESKNGCPFCQDNIFKVTPKFVGMKERMILNRSVLFPNQYPFSVFHAVAVFSPKMHFIGLNEFKPEILFDAIKNSINFLKAANRKRARFRNPGIEFNYMPPAAASIIHPHLQIILDDRPTFFENILIKKSLSYYRKFKTNYWIDLVKTEKERKERYIGKTGDFEWIADFSPLKNNQVSGILSKKISSLTKLNDKHLKNLSVGLSKIFKGLWLKNVRSLNMSIFSGPIGQDISNYFPVNLKIVSRPVTAKSYVSDIGFMELINQEPIIETLPEDVAKSLKLG